MIREKINSILAAEIKEHGFDNVKDCFTEKEWIRVQSSDADLGDLQNVAIIFGYEIEITVRKK